MPRVLHIVNKWKQGGVERFIEGLVSGCGDPDIQQSILSVCTDVPSDVECPKYGPMHAGESMVSMLLGARALDAFLAAQYFDAVHIHTQNSSGFLYAAIAKKNGVPNRIIHSHNSALGTDAGAVKEAAQVFFRVLYGGSETVRLACSAEAGRHLFLDKDFRVISNGIDIEKFRFDATARAEIRSDLALADDEILVACIGSMVKVKNQIRALSVFAEFLKRSPNAKLLILGDGELRPLLESEAASLGISKRVLMPGFVEDAYRWYNAMDAVLFPSLYEGLPISLVEAQCNGLPVVCSAGVTREAGLLGTCRFVDLSASDDEWVDALLSIARDFGSTPSEVVREKGFDSKSTLSTIEEIYKNFSKID